MRDIASLNEPAMYALGFDRVTVQAFAHILKAVGKATDGATLPDVAAGAEEGAVTLASLQIIVASLQALVGSIEVDRTDLPLSDNATQRRLADMQMELERTTMASSSAQRAIAELQEQMQAITITNTKLSQRIAELENGVT